MSQAFVKEPDGDEVFEDLPDRPISPHPNLVTVEGLALIDAELARLHHENAVAQVNNDRAALARVGRDLRYWTSRRSTADLVAAPTDRDRVQFGSTVTIERDEDAIKPTASSGKTRPILRAALSHTSHPWRGRCLARRSAKTSRRAIPRRRS